MTKFVFFLLIAVSLFVSLEAGSKTAAYENQTTSPTPTPKPLAELQSVSLDRDKVIIPCPPSKLVSELEGSACDDNMLVKIELSVSNPQNSQLGYFYTMSGGRIIGQGARVIWDLTGVAQGPHSITAQVKDKNGLSDKTITKTVEVRECLCDLIPCICPTLDVSGGGEIKAGETVDFTAHISGDDVKVYSYIWTVSQGEILSGQGTSKIFVKTTPEMTGTIIATVEIGGDAVCAECSRTASETTTIIK